jgi:hypothetical protein
VGKTIPPKPITKLHDKPSKYTHLAGMRRTKVNLAAIEEITQGLLVHFNDLAADGRWRPLLTDGPEIAKAYGRQLAEARIGAAQRSADPIAALTAAVALMPKLPDPIDRDFLMMLHPPGQERLTATLVAQYETLCTRLWEGAFWTARGNASSLSWKLICDPEDLPAELRD